MRDEWVAYHKNKLSPEARRRFDENLISDPSENEAFQKFSRVAEALESARPDTPEGYWRNFNVHLMDRIAEKRKPRFSFSWKLAIPAIATAALAVFFLVPHNTDDTTAVHPDVWNDLASSLESMETFSAFESGADIQIASEDVEETMVTADEWHDFSSALESIRFSVNETNANGTVWDKSAKEELLKTLDQTSII